MPHHLFQVLQAFPFNNHGLLDSGRANVQNQYCRKRFRSHLPRPSNQQGHGTVQETPSFNEVMDSIRKVNVQGLFCMKHLRNHLSLARPRRTATRTPTAGPSRRKPRTTAAAKPTVQHRGPQELQV